MFTFHNAIKLANVLKDVIKKDDAKLTWFEYFQKRTGTFNRSLSRYIRQGTKKFQSMSFRNSSILKRQFSSGVLIRHDSDSDEHDDDDQYESVQGMKRLKSNKSFTRTMSHNTKSFRRSVSRNTRQAAQKINTTLVGLVRSRFFRYCELLLITMNFITLCCHSANMSSSLAIRIRILQSPTFCQDNNQLRLHFSSCELIYLLISQSDLRT